MFVCIFCFYIDNNYIIFIREELCDVNKNDIDEIMPEFLFDCGLKVYGYNKIYDEYWGKKNNIDFTISLKKIGEKTIIKFNQCTISKEFNEIKKIFSNLLEIIEYLKIFDIYKSNF